METQQDHTALELPKPLMLCQLKVSRFRSLYQMESIPLQRGITALTGQNDGGKSSFLDAISFLLSEFAPDADDFSHGGTPEEPIEVEGLFISSNDEPHRDSLRIRAQVFRTGARQRDVLDRVHKGFQTHPNELTIGELRAHLTKLGIPSPGGTTKLPFQRAAESWISGRPAVEFEDRWRPATKLELARLPQLTKFFSVDAQNRENTVQQVVARESRRLLGEADYAIELSTISERLLVDIEPSLARTKETIRDHCPELDDIDIVASFDFAKLSPSVQLRLRQQGKEVRLQKAGQGRTRRVTLAIHEANSGIIEASSTDRTELIVYDEPDVHLDYSAQRLLFEILHRQASIDHVQVIVATHSKNFIDMMPLEALLHLRLDSDQRTHIDVLAEPEHQEELDFQSAVCAGLGLRHSVLLDERIFLIVEGSTETAALPELFRLVTGRSLVASGVHIIDTSGSGALRSFVTMLKQQFDKSVILLADIDAKGEEKGKISRRWLTDLGLEDGKGAYFIGTKEFEDAFEDSIWHRTLVEHFRPANGQPAWTEEDVANFRRQPRFSTGLLNAVRHRCEDAHVCKPDLGRSLAFTMRDCAATVPPVLQQCFDFINRAASRT